MKAGLLEISLKKISVIKQLRHLKQCKHFEILVAFKGIVVGGLTVFGNRAFRMAL